MTTTNLWMYLEYYVWKVFTVLLSISTPILKFLLRQKESTTIKVKGLLQITSQSKELSSCNQTGALFL